MSFIPVWTDEAASTFLQLQNAAADSLNKRQKNHKAKASPSEGLFKQVFKCVQLLLNSPKHPGLHTHAYDAIPHPYASHQKVFEAYVQNRTPGAYRLFWCYGPHQGDITIIAITPHP